MLHRVAMIKFAEPEQHDVFAEKNDLHELSQEPESNLDANSQSSTSSVIVFILIPIITRINPDLVIYICSYRCATGCGEISPLPEA